MNASYYEEMSAAVAGQVSDTSRYNIDGACVVANDVSEILVGVAVQAEIDNQINIVQNGGHLVIRPMDNTGKSKVYGFTIRSHYQTVSHINGEMVYEGGSAVNVITIGRVWVRCAAGTKAEFGTPVKVNAEGLVDDAGTIDTNGVTFTGSKTKFGNVDLVEIQLRGRLVN